MIMQLRWMRAGLALLLLAGVMPFGWAGCTAPATAGSLGTQNSFDVSSTPLTTSVSSGLKCTGSLLNLGGTNTIKATIGTTLHPSGTQPRLYSAATGQYLPYSLCKDGGCSTLYNQGSVITWTSTTALDLLGLFTAPNSTLPIFIRPQMNSNLAAGTYTDTIPISWDWNICSIALGPICVADSGSITSGSNINLSLVVSNYCYIDSAPNVGFGSAALPSGLTTVVSNTISVRCTLSASYSVNLTSSVASSGQYRQMASTVNGTTSYIQYQLFKGDSTVWTAATNSNATGTGTSQSFPYTASVNLSQNNQPAGSYSDTVTVTVAY
ncbi:spore coat U domain-containing protein [Serratia sp. T13T92]|jgi:spore coat protein U-like protein|uniref:Spore coat protein U domain-containing protein n=1 Tax=Serratia fonticola TaxID=47917 RepID=A0ABY9PUT5_SERFO|nr:MULTISPECIES: spore coat protein U domain-containing protein [Serratia]ATM78852.1 spore coat protein [Serratia fonticola]MBL5859809.1 spore coat U domain-containing protein [Serratia fonticola]MDK2375340.1 spore coat protein U domain-containing protein [Serratia fonticola]OCJ24530.1 spore coat protein [Serratia sp. 14-2641]WMT16953.1 spore coat protein U domain-containing protein [Serratia fonticola]